MASSSKLNYQIYNYILHLDMQNIYSTQWIRKIKEILQRCGLFNIWVNQHNIRIEDSKDYTNEIGDVFHYLFICPVFQEDRNRLLKDYYRKFPSMYKFIELMSTSNMKDLRKLAQFATIIIRKFQ